MYLLTAQEMRKLDELSIKRDGTPSLKLMENAGNGVFRVLTKTLRRLSNRRVAIFCGSGNNGGDGLVVARLLSKNKIPVFVFLLGDPAGLKGDPATEFARFTESGGHFDVCVKLSDIKKRFISLPRPGVVVDAIFGTGLSRPLKGFYRGVINWLNQLNVHRLSIDSPTGLSADTGLPLGSSFRADETVTLGLPKIGFFLNRARDYVGTLHVVDIGLSEKAMEDIDPKTFLITRDDVADLLTGRPRNAHKGSFGHVFTIGGSRGKIGAGIMAAHTALRAGAGLSTLIYPRSAMSQIDSGALEVMYEPIDDRGDGYFARGHAEEVLGLVSKASVVALGPGLGGNPRTVSFVHEFLKRYHGPLIIDADGLNAIAKGLRHLRGRSDLTLLTPHPGEMGRLIHKSSRYVQGHRLEVVHALSSRLGVHILLKGYRSLLCLNNDKFWINPTGSSAMASAGQGDVLTGIYAGLMAQERQATLRQGGTTGAPLKSLLFGCLLHGLVGDILAKKQRVVLATDIAKNLHLGYGFLKLERELLSTVFY